VDFAVQLVGPGGLPVSNFKPAVLLVYEDGQVVRPEGTQTLEGLQTIRDDICYLKVRIHELSKPHRNQRFCVVIVATGLFDGFAIARTSAMRVLSKTSIVLQHKQTMPQEEADRIRISQSALNAAQRKRDRSGCGVDVAADEWAPAKRQEMCAASAAEVAEVRDLLHQLVQHQSAMYAELQAMREEMRAALGGPSPQ